MTTLSNKAVVVILTCAIATFVTLFLVANDRGRYNSEVSIRHYDTKGTAKRIANALDLYSADNDDRLPPSLPMAEWQGQLKSYDKELYFESHNPVGGSIVPNKKVAGCNMRSELDSDTVLAFEEKDWRDGRKIYLFADKSSKFLLSDEPKKMDRPSRQK